MQGPEGRPPNVSPARKGWETDPEEDLSAAGAALNLSSTRAVSSRVIMGLRPTYKDENGSYSATSLPGSAALSFVISTGAQRSEEISVWMPLLGKKSNSLKGTG